MRGIIRVGGVVVAEVVAVTLRLDPDSEVAPYEQIRSHLADRVRTGELPAGARLPTVRALASELGLAVNTVARSYRELEHDGLIETRGRQGSFVAHDGTATERAAIAEAAAYAARIERLGLTPQRGLEMVSQAFERRDRPGS